MPLLESKEETITKFFGFLNLISNSNYLRNSVLHLNWSCPLLNKSQCRVCVDKNLIKNVMQCHQFLITY